MKLITHKAVQLLKLGVVLSSEAQVYNALLVEPRIRGSQGSSNMIVKVSPSKELISLIGTTLWT